MHRAKQSLYGFLQSGLVWGGAPSSMSMTSATSSVVGLNVNSFIFGVGPV